MNHPSIEADIRRLQRRRIVPFKPFTWLVDFFPLGLGDGFFPNRRNTGNLEIGPERYGHLANLIMFITIGLVLGLVLCTIASLLHASLLQFHLVDRGLKTSLYYALFAAPPIAAMTLFLVLRFNAPATRRYVEFFGARAQDGDRYAEIAVDWVTKRGYLARRDAELLLLAMERAEKVKSKASVVRRVIQRLNVANRTNRKARLTVLMGTALEAHAQARGLDQVTSTAGGETKPARRL